MKKFILFILTCAVCTSLSAQTCPETSGTGGNSAVRWLSSGLLTINWEAAGEGTTMFDALATSGPAIVLSGTVVGGTNDGNAFNLTLTKAEATNPSDTRIRPASTSNGNNGESATFSGTVTFNLEGGGSIICEYTEGVLPVELISFNAKAETNAIALNWQTASELNNDYFVLERSVDGRNFSEVTMVKGEGTSAVINEYRAMDNNPYKGVNYYRLRQVDFDGAEAFSNVVQVVFRTDKQAGVLTVYPTLIQNTDLLNVNLTENSKILSTFDIFDFNGKLVSSIELQGGDMTSFSVEQLQNGMYLIKERNSENNVATRFVIAR